MCVCLVLTADRLPCDGGRLACRPADEAHADPVQSRWRAGGGRGQEGADETSEISVPDWVGGARGCGQ